MPPCHWIRSQEASQMTRCMIDLEDYLGRNLKRRNSSIGGLAVRTASKADRASGKHCIST